MVAATGAPQDLSPIHQGIPSSPGSDGLTVLVWSQTTAAAQASLHRVARDIVDALEGASQQQKLAKLK